MKIKKEYSYTNKKQIWRLIPTDTRYMLIEERNTETKEVFFNCIEIESGKKIFQGLQFEEKFWIGIETVHNDVIYFNKYLKPDMPQHKGIIAFSINEQKIIWENINYVFLFIKDNLLYCYVQKFEGRTFYTVDCLTGTFIEELGENSAAINLLREEALNSRSYKGYLFPQQFYTDMEADQSLINFLNEFKNNNVTVGNIEFVRINDFLLMNCFEPNNNGSLNNIFRAIDIETEKVIFEEILNHDARAYVPDSFFIKNNYIFLLKDKTRLLVYSIKN